jgi:hypothetical protein
MIGGRHDVRLATIGGQQIAIGKRPDTRAKRTHARRACGLRIWQRRTGHPTNAAVGGIVQRIGFATVCRDEVTIVPPLSTTCQDARARFAFAGTIRQITGNPAKPAVVLVGQDIDASAVATCGPSLTVMRRRTPRNAFRRAQIANLTRRTRIVGHAPDTGMRGRFTRHHSPAEKIAVGIVIAPRNTRIVGFAILPRSANVVCRETRYARVRRRVANRYRRRAGAISIVRASRDTRIVGRAITSNRTNVIRRQTSYTNVCLGIAYWTERRTRTVRVRHATQRTTTLATDSTRRRTRLLPPAACRTSHACRPETSIIRETTSRKHDRQNRCHQNG